MEALIPIFRLIHFVGFALLLGGSLASVVLVKKESSNHAGIQSARICMHMLAAPGLVLLFLTGILHSSIIYWENFTGGGYMHVKSVLVVIIFALMLTDMRTQKAILRMPPQAETLPDSIKKRQALGMSICVLTFLVMWLVSFRPF